MAVAGVMNAPLFNYIGLGTTSQSVIDWHIELYNLFYFIGVGGKLDSVIGDATFRWILALGCQPRYLSVVRSVPLPPNCRRHILSKSQVCSTEHPRQANLLRVPNPPSAFHLNTQPPSTTPPPAPAPGPYLDHDIRSSSFLFAIPC